MGKLFGTDGVRGKAFKELKVSLAYNIGRALGVFKNSTVLVGRDTRFSGVFYKNAVIKGAKEAGLNVIDLNYISTPGIITLSLKHKTLAVMITASHNPYTDNGIKVIREGKKINENEINILEESIGTLVKYNGNSKTSCSKSEYVDKLKGFEIDKNLSVVFDCSNGALFKLSHQILKNYDFKYTIIHDKPNFFNINKNCGSQHLDSIKKIVKEKNADVGFAFDGDADRIVAVDKEGREYTGDHLLYAVANYYKEVGILKNNGVGLTIEANPGVSMSYKKKNINYSICGVGDPSLYKSMVENDYIIGAETSGHLINFIHSNTGDGILNALVILEILSKKKTNLYELTKDLEFYPIIRKNLSVFDDVIESADFKALISSLKEKANDEFAMILVRKSGTEHLLRISVSTKDEKLNQEFVDLIMKKVNGKI